MAIFGQPFGIDLVDNPLVFSPFVADQQIIDDTPPAPQLSLTTESGIFILTEGGIFLTTE